MRNLQARIEHHVQRATPIRMRQIQRAREESNKRRQETGQSVEFSTRVQATMNGVTKDELWKRVHVRKELKNVVESMLRNLQSTSCQVSDLQSFMTLAQNNATVCDLALLGLAKRLVELSVLEVVTE